MGFFTIITIYSVQMHINDKPKMMDCKKCTKKLLHPGLISGFCQYYKAELWKYAVQPVW